MCSLDSLADSAPGRVQRPDGHTGAARSDAGSTNDSAGPTNTGSTDGSAGPTNTSSTDGSAGAITAARGVTS